MSTQPKTFITPEQYLEIERTAEFKSEYFQGEMFSMAGAGRAHNGIAVNAVATLWNQTRGGACRIYGSDMRVFVNATGLYAYPDLTGVCGEQKFTGESENTLLNPVLLVEVLSPSTEAYDRGRKFDSYKSIPSLREYLLISADRIHADLYTRQPDDRWLLTSADRLEDALTLESIQAQVRLADIYENVEFGQTGPIMRPVHR